MATGREVEHFKIVIVGSGPAGLAAALHIVRLMPEMAQQVVILEADEHPRPKLCGGGITVHGTGQMESLNLTLDVPAFPIHELRFVLGQRTFTFSSPNVMQVIQREEFDAALAHAVTKQGLQLRCRERVVDIQSNVNGVAIHTRNRCYQAKVLVAADGAKSTIRRKLQLQPVAGVARLLRVMTPLNGDTRAESNTAEFNFSCIKDGVQGYVWHFPCVIDGHQWVNRGIFDSRVIPDQKKGSLKTAFFADLQTEKVDMKSIPLMGHPVRWFNRRSTFAQPHILLIGDAAGVDPLFAEGISFAMEYGEIAAETIQHAFQQDDFSFRGYRERLLNSSMGRLLNRRYWVARTLYRYRFPIFWDLLWRMAAIAPPQLQRIFGASLGLLKT